MLMTVLKHDADLHTEENNTATGPAKHVDQSLAEALTRTLDNIAVGVVIVGDDLSILHANHAARGMFSARSPIVSLGRQLVALRADLTAELKQAITFITQAGYRQSGIGVPLVNRDMTAAAAYIMPLNCPSLAPSKPVATIFVTSASQASRVDLSTVARTFRLTPTEGHVLRDLVSGKTLQEAANAHGITEAAAASVKRDIFAKLGVARLADLMILIGHLVPPIFQAQCF